MTIFKRLIAIVNVEVAKCLLLLIIAGTLLAIYIKMPYPATLANIKAGKLKSSQIPLVRVNGGNMDVEVSGGYISITDGNISCERY